MFCGTGGSKSRLAKAAGAEPSGEMRDEQLHADVARSRFASQNAKTASLSEHFRKLRCEKNARRFGRSASPSKNVKGTPLLEHFWKLRW